MKILKEQSEPKNLDGYLEPVSNDDVAIDQRQGTLRTVRRQDLRENG